MSANCQSCANNYYAFHAFLWENGTTKDLGTLGGSVSQAFAINESAQVVGQSSTDETGNYRHAFLWKDEIMTDLGTLGGRDSKACDINNSGQVVGESEYRAFLWENGTMRDLNTLLPEGSGWVLTGANAINDAGWIVGGGSIDGLYRAFLLKPNVVPEPLSCALFLFGGGALFAGQRFRRRA